MLIFDVELSGMCSSVTNGKIMITAAATAAAEKIAATIYLTIDSY